jgi:putative transposase
MPLRKTVTHFENTGELRFLTFSCYRRLPLLDERLREDFVDRLERARSRRRFDLYAYVVMPDHVHLIIRPDLPANPIPKVLSTIKRPFARGALHSWKAANDPRLQSVTSDGGAAHFWQQGPGFDRNLRTLGDFRSKLEYIHRNPVTRGLVDHPHEYRWSSIHWYA